MSTPIDPEGLPPLDPEEEAEILAELEALAVLEVARLEAEQEAEDGA